MFVYEKMTKNVVSIKYDETVSKAFQLMVESGHSQLPVVDKENKLKGIITEKILAQVNPSKATSLSVYEINHLLSKTKVYDIMQTGVFKIKEDMFIEDAAMLMKENHISSLPVVDSENRVVGIVTKIDILKAFIDMLGLKEDCSKIIIKSLGEKDEILEVCEIIISNGMNIRNILKRKISDKNEEITIMLDKAQNIQQIAKKIEEKGYSIIAIS